MEQLQVSQLFGWPINFILSVYCIAFAVPLSLRGDPSNEASLVLALFDYMSDKERREFHAQVESDWKAKQRKDRGAELLKLDKELRMLSADIPGSTVSNPRKGYRSSTHQVS